MDKPVSEIAKLTERISQDPKSKLFIALAEEYKKAGDSEMAIHVLIEGLKTNPTYVTARSVLGKILFEEGDIEGSRKEFEEVIKVIPDNLMAQRKLGDLYVLQNSPEKALKHYKIVFNFNPRDEELAALITDLEAGKDVRNKLHQPIPPAQPERIAATSTHTVSVPDERSKPLSGVQPAAAAVVAPVAPTAETPAVVEEAPAAQEEPQSVQSDAQRSSLFDESVSSEALLSDEGLDEEAEEVLFVEPLDEDEVVVPPADALAAPVIPMKESEEGGVFAESKQPEEPMEPSVNFLEKPFAAEPAELDEALPAISGTFAPAEGFGEAEEQAVADAGGSVYPDPLGQGMEELLPEIVSGEETEELGAGEPEAMVAEALEQLADGISEEATEPQVDEVNGSFFAEATEPVAEELAETPFAETPIQPTVDVESAEAAQPSEKSDDFTTDTLAELYIAQGFYEKAIDIYERMLADRPDSKGLQDKLALVRAKAAGADEQHEQAASAEAEPAAAPFGGVAELQQENVVEEEYIPLKGMSEAREYVPPAVTEEPATKPEEVPAPLDEQDGINLFAESHEFLTETEQDDASTSGNELPIDVFTPPPARNVAHVPPLFTDYEPKEYVIPQAGQDIQEPETGQIHAVAPGAAKIGKEKAIDRLETWLKNIKKE